VENNKRLNLSNAQLKWENGFKRALIAMSALLVLVIVGVLATLIVESLPSIKSLGIGFLWGKVWDPVSNFAQVNIGQILTIQV